MPKDKEGSACQKSESRSSRIWCITEMLSGLTPDQAPEWARNWAMHVEQVKYATWQLEAAPSTGQLHVQAAVRFATALRLAAVKRLFPTAHLEPAGNWERLKAYCTKEESRVAGPWERGRDLGRGHRSDLDAIAEGVAAGTDLRTIARDHPATYVRNYKGLAALQQLLHQPPAMERRVALFVGPTATGKTRMVYDNLDDVYSVFCIKSPWFDGYTGQRNVVLDECGPGMMNHNFLKRLLDRYPITVPVKGGSCAWMAQTIVLTSNVPIEEWFSGTNIHHADFAALKRRMRIFNFPDEKWLAECWVRGQIAPPSPEASVPSNDTVVNVESDEEPAQVLQSMFGPATQPIDLFDSD